MSRIVDLTLPVTSNMAGIPKIAFYEQYPTRVQAVTVVSEEQRATLAAEGVDCSARRARDQQHEHCVHAQHPYRHAYRRAAALLCRRRRDERRPLDRIVMREAVVLDVSHKAAGEGVTADDLERTGVKPAPGQIAVIKTSWTDRAFGKPEFWDNTIYLEPSVGEWIEARGVSAVAMDCFPEKPFWLMTLTPAERGANHKRWLKAGIPMIQMLTRLGSIAPEFHAGRAAAATAGHGRRARRG